MTAQRVFVGFGLGPIQSGLFLQEAFRSGCFRRLVVAEVVPELVAAVREHRGCVTINIARSDGVVQSRLEGIEVLNPWVPEDRRALTQAIAEADELATALPSVSFYEAGGDAAPAACLAEGWRRRDPSHQAVIYTAENDNYAAEALSACWPGGLPASVQVLNTVIGKMSGVVVGLSSQEGGGLAPLTPCTQRAILVEEFNRILISRIVLPGFRRGIEVFEEKDDLLPFEDAKLYGHNAIHALLGYLAHERGYTTVADAGADGELMAFTRTAFLEESGRGLLHRHGGRDALFTPAGFQEYAEDLLRRMVNPFLRDEVARVIRDPQRKLGWDDRLIGAIRLARAAGVCPFRLARGARAALDYLLGNETSHDRAEVLRSLWPSEAWQSVEGQAIAALVLEAK